MTHLELKEKFMAVLVVRELQPNSIGTYEYIYDSFIRYCDFIKINPVDITTEQILFYLAKIKSESTRRQAKGVISNFCEFVIGKGYLTYSIPNPKRHHQIPDYLSTFELNQIFNSIKNIKQRTIMKLEYACALRVNEVCKIKKIDFIKKWDISSGKHVYDLRIDGKGGNVEVVPIPNETITEIKNYYNRLSERDKQSEYLFKGQVKSCYSTRSVQQRFKKAMRDLKIVKYGNHNTHFLRISRGTHLLLAGVDINLVQRLLRHKSIKTTQQYYNGIKTSDMRVVFSVADKFLQENLEKETKIILQLKQA